jgi:hypothetical protein
MGGIDPFTISSTARRVPRQERERERESTLILSIDFYEFQIARETTLSNFWLFALLNTRRVQIQTCRLGKSEAMKGIDK